MQPTIVDIAERINVSNDKCSVRQKGLQFAKKLSYQLNFMVGKNTIGIVLPDYSLKFIDTECYNKLLNSLNSFLLQHSTQYNLLTSYFKEKCLCLFK